MRYSHYPQGLSTAAPVWVEPLPQVATINNNATQSYRITPLRGLSNMAITFVYEDTSRFGQFVRILWENRNGAFLLSNNIREGSGFHNKRTILLDATQLSSPGTLTIQSSSQRLAVTSVHFVWVMATEMLIPVDETPDAQLITETGRSIGYEELSGEPPRPPIELYLENALHGDVLTAPILETPLALSGQNTLFEFALAGESPALVRIKLEINGLETNSDVEIFLNGQSIGALAVEAPDLRDAGYQWTVPGAFATRAQMTYIGWREGTFLLPGEFLQQGKNYIHFRTIDSQMPNIVKPVAIRNFVMQLKYRPHDNGLHRRDTAKKTPQRSEFLPITTGLDQFYDDDLFDPLPTAEPDPAFDAILTPRPVSPGPANDSTPDPLLQGLWHTGSLLQNSSRHEICFAPSNLNNQITL